MSKFNSDFYVTAATVIPVLYLALTLQGTMFDNLMSQWREIGQKNRMISIRYVAVTFLAFFITIGILWGMYGEVLALKALYFQNLKASDKGRVLEAILILLIMAVAGPLIRFFSVYFAPLMRDFKSSKNTDAATAEEEEEEEEEEGEVAAQQAEHPEEGRS